MDTVLAVASVIEVDAIFAVAATPSFRHTGSLQLGSHIGSHVERQKIEHCR